jgi:murein tripeptide amidase MpaA
MEGLVLFLLSDCLEAEELRRNYIIYVVPMLNIDGVVHGNQRTNLSGFD